MTTASSLYVARTAPNEKPVVFSQRTKTGFRRVHMVTGHAVKVTAKTTSVIHDAVARTVGYVASGGKDVASSNGKKDQVIGSPSIPQPPPPPPAYLDIQVPYRTYSSTSSARRRLPHRSNTYSNENENEGMSSSLPAPQPIRIITSPPPLPPRQLGEKGRPSSVPRTSAPFPPPPLPPRPHSGASKSNPCSYSPSSPSSSSSSAEPSRSTSSPPPKLFTRLRLSTDMLLSTIENSASTLASTGMSSLSTTLGHKYGADAGEATKLVGEAVRNVGLVYVDVRGVGRKALIKGAGKGYVKAKIAKKSDKGKGDEGEQVVLLGGVGGQVESYSPDPTAPKGYGVPGMSPGMNASTSKTTVSRISDNSYKDRQS